MNIGGLAQTGDIRLEPPFVLLEDRIATRPAGQFYSGAIELVRCDGPEGVQDAFDRIEAGLARGLHAAGHLAYELGHVLEPRLTPLMPAKRHAPLIHIGLFPPPRHVSGKDLDKLFSDLGPPPTLRDVHPGHDRATHVGKVQRILDLIGAGDIYQANLTFPLTFRYDGDPRRLYGTMRVRQPTAHGGVMALDDTWVLSASPELFLRVVDGVAVSRPMKGTVARGVGLDADRMAARALLADPKQRAENIMIVDLIRNDLARISLPGSVQVPDLLTVETYPDLHTLTSTVTAQLRPGVRLRDQLAAVFPCGSIVGAPKIRAAELLCDLEDEARGIYTGAIGSFHPNGDMDLAVAIRTAQVRSDGCGVYGVGGGIVADSDPEAEYDEARLKGRMLEDMAQDYGLIETLRWSWVEGFIRLERHLDRLAQSSALLGFQFSRSIVQAQLADRCADWAAGACDQRVRLELKRCGDLTISCAPAPTPDGRLQRLGVASVRLDAGDAFLRHKTTRRTAYEQAFAEATRAGLDEAILFNRSGLLADASRHSLFVQIEGRLVTPRLEDGALAGVLRADMLENGRAVEGELTMAALMQAQALFIGNSLNGLRRGELAIQVR